MKIYQFYEMMKGRLRGLVVVLWTTYYYHPYSNLGVGISQGCFKFNKNNKKQQILVENDVHIPNKIG